MKLYLKHNIQFAPYNWNWYAWSHLIAPHTAAANISERHIKIMESFVDAPELHVEAIKTRGLIGGPFINLDASYQNRIKELLTETRSQCAALLNLHRDIKEFSGVLKQEAQGIGLESLYAKLPSSLKGMVELVYDLQNNPQLRFVEALVYAKYYQHMDQSICFAETIDDNRSFSLSTPYVENKNTLQLSLPFASPIIDRLARMKSHADSFSDVLDECQISAGQRDLFTSFFTEQVPVQSHTAVEGVRVRYFGHACVLLETNNTSILIDPALGYQFDTERNDRYTMADLPATIDYILITHNHQDHLLLETLLQLRHKTTTVIVPSCNNGSLADPSLKLILKHLGFKHVIAMDEFDEELLGNEGVIKALPFFGEHGDLNIQSKRSYYINLLDKRFLFLADSNNMDNELYHRMYDVVGKVDILFIGMECVGAPASWLYGPLFPLALARDHDRSRRLSGSNADKAWGIISIFQPQEVYVYAMGMEPWLGYIMAIHYQDSSPPIVESNKLIAKCQEQHIQAKRLYGKQEWHYQVST